MSYDAVLFNETKKADTSIDFYLFLIQLKHPLAIHEGELTTENERL